MHIGEFILKKLKEKERSIAWLSRQVNCNRANLGRLLKNSPHIHGELLWRISTVMEEDFFAHCSEEFSKSKLL
jgi:hypothetical protein